MCIHSKFTRAHSAPHNEHDSVQPTELLQKYIRGMNTSKYNSFYLLQLQTAYLIKE